MLRLLQQILFLLNKKEKLEGVWLLLLMVIGMIMETVGVSLVIPVATLLIQDNGGQKNSWLAEVMKHFNNPSQSVVICWGMLLLVMVFLVKNCYLAFMNWTQGKYIYSVQNHLSQRLFWTYLRAPYSFHLSRNSAQLITNATAEVMQFSTALTAVTVLLTEGLVVVGIGALLVYVQPLGAIANALGLGVMSWIFFNITKSKSARWGALRQKHDAIRAQHLQQGLGSAKDIKLLGREKAFFELFRTHDLKTAEMRRKQATLQLLPRFWLEIMAVIALSAVVLTMIYQGKPPEQIVPTIGVFAAAAFRLMPSASKILFSIQVLKYTEAGIHELHGEFAIKPSHQSEPVGVHQNKEFKSEIRLENVGFVYPLAARPALRGIGISIKKGELVGFIGTSGSGKSTLIDIILGLLTPTSGRVLVDGSDIQEALRAWQDQIGYVPQSIYLTDDSLRSNVAFGLPPEQIDDLAVRRAITAAQLDGYVSGLPDGVETFVGERGVRLSGGQRQRIGIARALYHDPAVLVMDEATSALDEETEKAFMEAINNLHGQKTIIIIAHRTSTVRQCDRIFRLEHGEITGEGQPEEMLAAGVALETTS